MWPHSSNPPINVTPKESKGQGPSPGTEHCSVPVSSTGLDIIWSRSRSRWWDRTWSGPGLGPVDGTESSLVPDPVPNLGPESGSSGQSRSHFLDQEAGSYNVSWVRSYNAAYATKSYFDGKRTYYYWCCCSIGNRAGDRFNPLPISLQGRKQYMNVVE